MRVLIVDAFSAKAEDRRLYELFEKAVHHGLSKVDVGGVQIEYADRGEVGRYIYKSSEPRSGTSGMKTFDRLDLVFIGADAELLPWAPAAKDLFTLVHMCHVSRKCVFGSSSVANFFAMCTATNGLEIRPLNGLAGSQLSTMQATTLARNVRVPKRDVFLDCETGDLFSFDLYQGKWCPYTNVGIKLKSKQFAAVHKHVAHSVAPRERLYTSKSNEVVCRVSTKAVSHWLFRGVREQEFIVRSRPTWMLDATTNLRSHEPYHVLAESKFAPLVIKSRNFVCAQFDISPEYPVSVQVLENFVKSRVAKLVHHEYVDKNGALYLAFHSQNEAATQRVALSPRDGARSPPRWAQKTRANLNRPGIADTEPVSQPELAAPSDCVFLRTSRSEYKLTRSKARVQRQRDTRRPASAALRKSNFAASDTAEFKSTACALGQTRRLESARRRRNQQVKFPTKADRPQTASLSCVRSSDHETLLKAAHKRIDPQPVHDKFNSGKIAVETVELQKRRLANTENLRIFRVKASLTMRVARRGSNPSVEAAEACAKAAEIAAAAAGKLPKGPGLAGARPKSAKANRLADQDPAGLRRPFSAGPQRSRVEDLPGAASEQGNQAEDGPRFQPFVKVASQAQLRAPHPDVLRKARRAAAQASTGW